MRADYITRAFRVALALTLTLSGMITQGHAEEVDYPRERAAAVALLNAGKTEPALEAFLKLADRAGSDRQKTDALEQAAVAAQVLGRAEQADALALRISLKPNAATMRLRLLLMRGQFATMVEEFEKQSVTDWPDEVAGEALFYRARSHYALGHGDKAETDLQQSLARIGEGELRGQAGLLRGDNFRDRLRDPQRALTAYRTVFDIERRRTPMGWIHLTGLTQSVTLLCDAGNPDEAEKLMSTLGDAKSSGYWDTALLTARAEILAASGKHPEAIALLEAELKSSAIPAHQRQHCNNLMTRWRSQKPKK